MFSVCYCSVMKIIMSIQYSVIIMVFIPLFAVVMHLLRTNFTELFTRVRVKAVLFGVIFIIVLIFRYTCYMVLQFSKENWASVESLRNEIPFYISEVFIALCYLKFMVSLYQKNKK